MNRIILLVAVLLLLVSCAKPEPPSEPTRPVIEEPPAEETPEPEPEVAVEPKQPVAKPLTQTISPARDLTGNWAGSITFTNNCANPSCKYIGKMSPPALTMNLQQNGNQVVGGVTVDFANFEIEELIPGQGCGTFAQLVNQGAVSVSPINNGVVSASRFTFNDVGGNVWSLQLTTDLLQGIISSNAPGCMGIKSDKVSLRRS